MDLRLYEAMRCGEEIVEGKSIEYGVPTLWSHTNHGLHRLGGNRKIIIAAVRGDSSTPATKRETISTEDKDFASQRLRYVFTLVNSCLPRPYFHYGSMCPILTEGRNSEHQEDDANSRMHL